MALIYYLTEDPANVLLPTHYRSTEIPFKNLAMIIITLYSVYHNDNQDSKACKKLCMLEYNVDAKEWTFTSLLGQSTVMLTKPT
jgi:hypothetical protein